MKKIIFIFALILVPHITSASVYISEIMYDLDGTDSGREWIEVHNDTSENIDLSIYFLYENNVAHRVEGSESLVSGGYAVIADSVEKFLEDFPSFSGEIFDSSFGLNNSGEELVLLDSNKEEVNKVTYSPDLGAKGTGNSLQYYEGVFIPGNPTPGKINITEAENETIDETVDNSDTKYTDTESAHSGQNGLSDYIPATKSKTGLGRDRIVPINTPVEFEVFLSGEEKGRHFWNFGDGKKGLGGIVKHTYKHEGEFNVVLNSFFKGYKNTSRVRVFVEEPSLEVSQGPAGVEIKNVGDSEINIGGFHIKMNNNEEVVLKDTIISKGHIFYIDSDVEVESFSLLYPDGEEYYSNLHYKAEKFCTKVEQYGQECNVQKIIEIFDRM